MFVGIGKVHYCGKLDSEHRLWAHPVTKQLIQSPDGSFTHPQDTFQFLPSFIHSQEQVPIPCSIGLFTNKYVFF